MHDHAPAGNWNTTTLIAAMGINGPLAPLLLEGATALRAVNTTDVAGWFKHCGYDI